MSILLLNYVSLPSSYIYLYVLYVCLLYSLMIIREKPAIITYMCTYTYVYDEKKGDWQYRLLTPLRIGSYFSRTTSNRLLSIGKRSIIHVHLMKKRFKYMAKFSISLLIMNIHTCRTTFLFLLLFLFFSSSKWQLRFGLVSLLLVARRLHHHYTSTSSSIHISALLLKSIWIRRKFKAYLPKLLTWWERGRYIEKETEWWPDSAMRHIKYQSTGRRWSNLSGILTSNLLVSLLYRLIASALVYIQLKIEMKKKKEKDEYD